MEQYRFRGSGFRVQKTEDREQSTEVRGPSFVVVLVLDTIPIHEDEYEKNQIRSHALRLFIFSAFLERRIENL